MSLLKQARGAAISAFLGSPGRTASRLVDEARRFRRREPRAIELYYQVGDPYSYLLAQVLPRLRRRYPVDLRFLLAPPPRADADPAPEARALYAVRDARLLAERFEVEFPAEAALPSADLVREANAILAAKRSIDEQLEVASAVGDALWRGDAAAMATARQQAGAAPGRVEDLLRDTDARRTALRHYLSGMLFYRGEWFWGLDRLHYLEARLGDECGEPAGDSVLHRRPAGRPTSETSADESRPRALDLFFSYRSPYSYLALERTFRLADRHGLDLTVKPVLPMVMRGMAVPSAKRIYIVLDCKREAERLGIPFGRICDPVGRGVERCLALQRRARELGLERDFLRSAARGIWAEALDVADDRDLRRAAERAGLSWSDCRRALADDSWRAEVDGNRDELMSLGLWGVPCFRFGRFTTWGQDRIEALEERIAHRD